MVGDALKVVQCCFYDRYKVEKSDISCHREHTVILLRRHSGNYCCCIYHVIGTNGANDLLIVVFYRSFRCRSGFGFLKERIFMCEKMYARKHDIVRYKKKQQE
jgi:hypothetical protein